MMTTEVSEEERVAQDKLAAEKEAFEQSQLPYKWTQTLQELSVSLPSNSAKSKQIKFQVKKRHLFVQVLDQVVIDGDLYADVKVEDCTWTLDSGEVCIHLEKVNKMEWY